MGVPFAVLGAASPIIFAADTATAVTLALVHLSAGVAWFIGLASPWQGSPVRAANRSTA